jgi:hypothetical protein
MPKNIRELKQIVLYRDSGSSQTRVVQSCPHCLLPKYFFSVTDGNESTEVIMQRVGEEENSTVYEAVRSDSAVRSSATDYTSQPDWSRSCLRLCDGNNFHLEFGSENNTVNSQVMHGLKGLISLDSKLQPFTIHLLWSLQRSLCFCCFFIFYHNSVSNSSYRMPRRMKMKFGR